MSKNEIEKEIERLQLTTLKRRRWLNLKDLWLWAFAVIVAFDMLGRMLLVVVLFVFGGYFGLYVPAWVMYVFLLFMLAPFPVYLQMANVRKRVIAMESVLLNMKIENHVTEAVKGRKKAAKK